MATSKKISKISSFTPSPFSWLDGMPAITTSATFGTASGFYVNEAFKKTTEGALSVGVIGGGVAGGGYVQHDGTSPRQARKTVTATDLGVLYNDIMGLLSLIRAKKTGQPML